MSVRQTVRLGTGTEFHWNSLPRSHYSRVIYNAQHPHNQLHRTYQNYASTASTVSTLAQFNYNNPESYPYTPTTPPTTVTDISATTPTNRLELSASALAGSGGGGRYGGGGGSRVSYTVKDSDEEEQFASVRIQVSEGTKSNCPLIDVTLVVFYSTVRLLFCGPRRRNYVTPPPGENR